MAPSVMAHPKDRSGLSRKELLTGAAAGAVGVGVLGGLAACQNTTTPIGTGESGAGSPLVDAKPVGPGGLPLPRPDNSVTWAITDDNQPIAEGTPVEAGPLQVYNYPDYIYPAPRQEVREAARDEGRDRDLQLGGRGDREARLGPGHVRRRDGPLGRRTSSA